MKTIVGVIAAAVFALSMVGVASAGIPCPEDPSTCIANIPDVHPGSYKHVTFDVDDTCVPVIVAHRVSRENDWSSQSAAGTYAVVSGLTPGQISFVVKNDSNRREDIWLGFLWDCL